MLTPHARPHTRRAQGGMFEVLRSIAESLDEDAHPSTVARCAEFFIEHGQVDKAVKLFITGKRYRMAIDLCLEHRVPITEEIADGLTPPKPGGSGGLSDGADGDGADGDGAGEGKFGGRSGSGSAAAASAEEDRLDTIRSLARACKKQGSFTLACKKFTQAGEREKAMKCLLKAGDTKAVCYYATVSRNRNIYILAANYLQALDWQNDAEVTRTHAHAHTRTHPRARLHR